VEDAAGAVEDPAPGKGAEGFSTKSALRIFNVTLPSLFVIMVTNHSECGTGLAMGRVGLLPLPPPKDPAVPARSCNLGEN